MKSTWKPPREAERRNTLDKPRNYPLPSPPPAHPRPFETVSVVGWLVEEPCGAFVEEIGGQVRCGRTPLRCTPDRRGGGGAAVCTTTTPPLYSTRCAARISGGCRWMDGMHTPTLPSCTSEGARCLRGAAPPCLAMRPRRDGMGRTPQRDARVREFAPNLPVTRLHARRRWAQIEAVEGGDRSCPQRGGRRRFHLPASAPSPPAE